jgi:hypothetical protein
MSPEISLLNCILQGTAASLRQVLQHTIFIYLHIILSFLNDAFKTVQNTASTDRMISQ